MADKNLKCIDCKNDFIFTEGEQKFYKGKGYKDPKRCTDCRYQNRKKKEEGGENEI